MLKKSPFSLEAVKKNKKKYFFFTQLIVVQIQKAKLQNCKKDRNASWFFCVCFFFFRAKIGIIAMAMLFLSFSSWEFLVFQTNKGRNSTRVIPWSIYVFPVHLRTTEHTMKCFCKDSHHCTSWQVRPVHFWVQA